MSIQRYTPKTWVNGETPIDAGNLNPMESGIGDSFGYTDQQIQTVLSGIKVQTDCLLRTCQYNPTDPFNIDRFRVLPIPIAYGLHIINPASQANATPNDNALQYHDADFTEYDTLTFVTKFFDNVGGTSITIPMQAFKQHNVSSLSKVVIPIWSGVTSGNDYGIWYSTSGGTDRVYIQGTQTTGGTASSGAQGGYSGGNSAYGIEIWGTKLVIPEYVVY